MRFFSVLFHILLSGFFLLSGTNLSGQQISRNPSHYTGFPLVGVFAANPFSPSIATSDIDTLRLLVPCATFSSASAVLEIPLIGDVGGVANLLAFSSIPVGAANFVTSVPVDIGISSAEATVIENPALPGSRILRIAPNEVLGKNVYVIDLNIPGVDLVRFEILVRCSPLQLDFVLDRSGSMGCAPDYDIASSGWPCPTPATSRWEVLSTAVNLFLNKLLTYQQAGDQVGITLFHSNSAANFSGGGFAGGLVDLNAANIAGASTLSSATPGGNTPMGTGLTTSKAKLPGPGPSNRVMILFTDGEQNGATEQRVNAAGTNLNGPPATALNDGSGDERIQILPVATVNYGSAPAILNSIAGSNGAGSALIPPVGTANIPNFLLAAFDMRLAEMLADNSPQLIDFETLVSNPSDTLNRTFLVNKGVESLIIEVVPLDGRGRVNWWVEKDGQIFFPRPLPGSETTSLFQIQFPYRDERQRRTEPEGKWNLRMATRLKREVYVSATVDDHYLDYNVSLGPQSPNFVVEDPLELTVELRHDHLPITGAEVEAIVLRPGEDIGDLLARTNLPLDPSSAIEAGSLGMQKLRKFLEDKSFLAKIQPKDDVLKLTESSPGNYTASFTDTDLTGVYQVIFWMKGSTDPTGLFTRKHLSTAHFLFGEIDMEASGHSIDQRDDYTVVTFKPAYRVGGKLRYVGPGFDQLFDFTNSPTRAHSVDEQADGTYDLVLNGDPDSRVDIQFGGRPLYKGKISNFGGKSLIDQIEDIFDQLGLPHTLGWILFILLVLIVLIMLFRLRRRP